MSGNEITDAVRTAALSGDGLTVPAGFGIWPATTPISLGAFATGVESWTLRSSATISQSTDQAKFGTHSLKVVTGGSGSNDGATSPFPAVVSGTAYTIGVWVYRTETTATITFTWRNSANNATVATANIPQTLGWTFTRITATPSESLTEFFWVASTNVGAITYYVGSWQWESGSIATPFIGDGNTTRAAGRVQVASTLLSASQGWLSFTWVYRSVAGAAEQLFNWSAGVNDNIQCFLNSGATAFVFNHSHGGTLVSNSSNLSPTAGQRINVTIAWTASGTTIYVNGAGKSTAVITGTPVGLPSLFDVGSSGSGAPIDGELRWVAAGTGTLTDADAATLNGFGSTPPNWMKLMALNCGDCRLTGFWDAAGPAMQMAA